MILQKLDSIRWWPLYALASLILVGGLTFAVALYTGYFTAVLADIERAKESRASEPEKTVLRSIGFGPASLKERISGVNVIARVSLDSVSKATLFYDSPTNGQDRSFPDGHVSAMEFTFDVQEFLKGAGGSELVGIVYSVDVFYETRLIAQLMGLDLRTERDTQWDEREAIVFLSDIDIDHPLASSRDSDRYLLGWIWREDLYSIASRRVLLRFSVCEPGA